jgi:hypothetical protein
VRRLRYWTAVVLMALACPAQAQTFTGFPTVVDGDTLAIGAQRIRLQGIDAPEIDQTCLDGTGTLWRCGAAREELTFTSFRYGPGRLERRTDAGAGGTSRPRCCRATPSAPCGN